MTLFSSTVIPLSESRPTNWWSATRCRRTVVRWFGGSVDRWIGGSWSTLRLL